MTSPIESSVTAEDLDGGARLIVAGGAIGGDAEQRLANELTAAARDGRPVALDLTGVTDIDAGATRAILDAQRDAADAGRPFVAALDAAAALEQRTSVNLAALLGAVPRVRTREEAVDALR